MLVNFIAFSLLVTLHLLHNKLVVSQIKAPIRFIITLVVHIILLFEKSSFSLQLCLQEKNIIYFQLPEPSETLQNNFQQKTFCKHNLFLNIQLWSGSTGLSAEKTWTPPLTPHSKILIQVVAGKGKTHSSGLILRNHDILVPNKSWNPVLPKP